MNKHIYPIIAFVVLLSQQLNAQKIDSTLEKYANDYSQEKIHIHFDKGIYDKGETIWFKAYILTGIDLSDCSKNFYVDWFDDKGNLISHTVSPMFQSSARGQFSIPADYKGKFIHVKAYTQWMLNFDTAFLYNKDVKINQLHSSSVAGTTEETKKRKKPAKKKKH